MSSSHAVTDKAHHVPAAPKSLTWVPSLALGLVLVGEEILEHLVDLSWQQYALLHVVILAVVMATAGVLPRLAWKRVPRDRDVTSGPAEALAAGQRFRALVEHASGGAALFDSTGVLLYASPALRRVLGYLPEEWAGRTVLHLVHPEDAARAPAMLADLLARPGGWTSGSLRARHRDGTWRWLGLVLTNLLDDPEVGALLCHYRDITERKRAEEIASRGEAILASMSAGLVAVDLTGSVVEMNPAALRLHGFEGIEEARSHLRPAAETFELLDSHGRAIPAEARPVARVLRGETFTEYEAGLRRRDTGANRVLSYSGTLARDPEGRPTLGILTLHDLTGERQADEALAERARLATLSAEIGLAFLGTDDLGVNLGRCVEAVTLHLGADQAGVWLQDAAGAGLELAATAGVDPGWDDPPGSLPVERTVIGTIAEERQPLCTDAAGGDPRFRNDAWAEGGGRRAFAGLPLLVEDRLIGVLALRGRRPLSATAVDVLQVLASSLALNIERKRTKQALRRANEELEARVQARTAELVQAGKELAAEVVERRRAEEALQSLFEGVPLGLFRTTPAGEILDANLALVQMLGCPSRDALLRTRVASFYVNPADRERWVAQIEREGLVRGFDVRMRRRDGRSIWVRVSARAVRDPDGHVRHYEGMVEDISDRTRDADALRKLSSAVEQTADAVCITDREGIIEYVNPAFERMSGYPHHEARGQTPRILKSGRHADGFYADLWRTILNGEVLRCEVVNRRKDGTLYDSELAITPIRDAAGQITHFVATQRDITERTAAQDRLRESEEQLRAFATRVEAVREEERARIAREIHDELGQAMTSLKIDLAWLARRLDGPPTLLVGKVDSMLVLIDSTIRSVRRIATELRPGVLDDFGLVAAMEWQAQEFEARTGIACVFDADAPDPGLRPEHSIAVFRIMQEALTNVARHAAATEVTITFRREGDTLSLTVLDNGSGIREQDIGSRKSLGLLGMRERAHLVGGRVAIVGSPGGGTRVTVTVPWQDSLEATP